jgi:5-methylcytosine-specific restriction endonuclease McrBC regulatory subunit McrC
MKNLVPTSTSLPFLSKEICESETLSISLSETQVRQLRNLGKSLAGQKRYWGSELDAVSEPSVLEVQPSSEYGKWNLTVRNAVGYVSIEDLNLKVRPKIPWQHFMHIANATSIFGRFSKAPNRMEEFNDFAEAFIRNFLDESVKYLQAAMHLDYELQKSALDSPRGQIIPLETLINLRKGRIGIVCRHDDLVEDNFLNRVIKGALTKISTLPLVSSDLKTIASRLNRSIFAAEFSVNDLEKLSSQIPARFETIASLAKLIITNTYSAGNGKGANGYSFLVPTPPLIESGLRNLLRIGLPPDIVLSPTAARKVLQPQRISVNPDLLLAVRQADKSNPEIVTGDVKYQIRSGNWKRANFYQAVTFATAFFANRGFVIDFSEQKNPDQSLVQIGPLELTIFDWDIAPGSTPSASLATLVNEIHFWISNK